METSTHYDCIIIGSGAAGRPLASFLPNKGLKTLLVEKDKIGGTCINYGCLPSKALMASAHAVYFEQKARRLGVEITTKPVDSESILARKDKFIHHLQGKTQEHLEQTEGLSIVYGSASFVDTHTIKVGEQHFSADKIFINTGLVPLVPAIDGLNEIPYITSNEALQLEFPAPIPKGELPKKLIILGGGVIALEFSQFFARLGVRVQLVEKEPTLAPQIDNEAGMYLMNLLKKEGIDFYLGEKAIAAKKVENDCIQLTLEDGSTISGDCLLVATGRKPEVKALSLENAGIAVDEKGFISVNEFCQTSVAHIFACGDITGSPAFTNVSYDDFRVLRYFLNGEENYFRKHRLFAWTVFTQPELAACGLQEKELIEQEIAFKTASLPLRFAGRALAEEEKEGFFKVFIDKELNTILGAVILSDMAGELINLILLAIHQKTDYRVLKDLCFAHPTFSEFWNNVMASVKE